MVHVVTAEIASVTVTFSLGYSTYFQEVNKTNVGNPKPSADLDL